MNRYVVADEQGRAYLSATGAPVLSHGHPTWVPNHDRWQLLTDRVTRMTAEVGPPERIVLSVDICGQEIDPYRGERPILGAPVRCDEALPPNSIVFEGSGLATAEAP